MCELFAMSSDQPSTIRYSLPEFAQNGGGARSNKSGWGIAYFQQRDAFLIKEPNPASESPWVSFVAQQDIASHYVIAHIRLATIGKPALHNTHPFRFCVDGKVHVFAHNGTLHGLDSYAKNRDLVHQPVGDTDSELAFCLLLDHLKKNHCTGDPKKQNSLEKRCEKFAEFCSTMRKYGTANFLYCAGDVLFAHADKRIYEYADGSFSKPRPPGMHMRNCRSCAQEKELSCCGLHVGYGDQKTVLFASVPLDDARWENLPQGIVVAVAQGEEICRIAT